MHIYKQPLRHEHTLIIFFLSASVSLYLSKANTHIHTLAFDFPFKLQRGTWSDDEDRD